MSPNLIQLDTSFEIEDFDPLNQNAKTIPTIISRTPAQKSQELVSAITSNTYNPVYPNTFHGAMAAAPPQALPRRREIDAESELLQQYGLLSLLDSSSSTTKQPQANGSAPRSYRKDWTEFD